MEANKDVKKSSRRSKKIKNLQEEVELIFSQNESDEELQLNSVESVSKTPSRSVKTINITTPSASEAILQDMMQTPRRSCRKSIKPTQDYEDIVNKSSRFCTRSASKLLVAAEDVENSENELVQPKWTPAKVGRVSQKRGRKSRRNTKGNKKANHENNEPEDEKNKNNLEFKEVEHENLNEVVECVKPEQNKILAENSKEVEKENETYDETANDDPLDKQEVTQENDIFEVEESIHLIQEDSEDCKFVEKAKDDDICIVYEINISNSDIKAESKNNLQDISSKTKMFKEELQDSFGSYLKSNDINMFDLGLNPLKDDEDEKHDIIKVEKLRKSLEAEEMPSLIVCDEDEEKACDDNKKLNETFEANDSVKVVAKKEEKSLKKYNKDSDILQMSEDDSVTPRKLPRVVLTDTESRNQTLLSTPKNLRFKRKLPSTPKAVTLILPSTPKPSAKITRVLTPYRNKQSFQFNNVVEENAVFKDCSLNTSTMALTTMEPKEIVLRGIRKRSLSLCIDGNENKFAKFLTGPSAKVKQDRIVSFYSPANQTTIIDDLDVLIAKSLKKQKPQENNGPSKFVTTRRKRSLSFDESIMSISLMSKLPRPVANQNVLSKTQTSTLSTSKPLARTKLPNFAAIHQKQFQKMENLVEHVSRKQERSKNLINSSTKLRPVSAQKNIPIIKNSSNIVREKPKALKKIDLGSSSEINKSILNISHETQDISAKKALINLPDPRLATTKPLKTETISHRQPHQQQIKKYLKPLQTTNTEMAKTNAKVVPTKPIFNLSTSLMVKPSTSSTRIAEKANLSHINSENKMPSRMQRHMDMFKSRDTSERAGAASRKNKVILKGVRSNRRFELQMQHRKNMEQ